MDPNDVVYLGDDTRSCIAGSDTTVITLNGQIVLLRNAMHMPTMKQPLYSLTRHYLHPGCGIYADRKVGTMILFPTFVIKADNPADCLVSYSPIGRDLKNQTVN